MMKLADMRDLGSRALWRWGSSPHARTKNKTICQRQMVLFLGSAPCGRSTPRGSNMPGASELPLRQDFAAQNTCDGAPAPPRRVGAWFGRRPYCCIMARRSETHARFTALQQHITVLLQMPKTPLLCKKLGYTGKWKDCLLYTSPSPRDRG